MQSLACAQNTLLLDDVGLLALQRADRLRRHLHFVLAVLPSFLVAQPEDELDLLKASLASNNDLGYHNEVCPTLNQREWSPPTPHRKRI